MNEDRILLGMHRPDFNEFMKDIRGNIQCICGSLLSFRQGTFDHWQMGHFDYPVYATKEEVMEKLAEKLAVKGV